MLSRSFPRYTAILLIGVICTLIACKKDKEKPVYPVGSNENINQWLFDSLQRYYYWNENLPHATGLGREPEDFFTSILDPLDRFSYIILPNVPSSWRRSNKSQYGFDYSTLQTQHGEVFGIVKMTLFDSPASRAGLKRGDYFVKINGKRITSNNAQALQDELLTGNKVELGMANYENGQFIETEPVEVTAGHSFEQPAYSKLIQAHHSKAGYIYCVDFNPGLAASLYGSFASFRNEGVTDLILDLRYNSGGQVAEAAALCAMIAPAINYNTPFITYKGNKYGGVKTESLGTTATFDGTVNFNTLLQNNLGLNRVFILGTAATASAAEIMINNLYPFLKVIFIGEKTRGKDEASFPITDMRNPKQVDWEIHPIIYKLFNTQGKGNYSSGLAPDITVHEFDLLPLLPFGEEEDLLLKTALSIIDGNTPVPDGERPLSSRLNIRSVLTDTHDRKAGESIVITHR